ncbi:MAM domain-containing protein 2-like [Glandiceps talaboti]
MKSDNSKIGDGFTCDFETDMCGMTNDEGNPSDWVRNQGATPTANTGPSYDHTTGASGGYYVFASAVGVGSLHRAKIFTKTYSSTTNSCLKFWYHMYGKDCGFLSIIVKDVDNGIDTTVWKRWFNKGNQWLQGEANLESAGSYQMRTKDVQKR